MDPALWEQISAVEDRHWWFTARREILLHLIGQTVPDGASILDIGCGTGFMLEALLPRYDAWGMEPDAAVRARVRPSVRDRVLAGDTGDLSAVSDRRFDLALLLDVLEHTRDDTAALRDATTAMESSGKLLLTVPADPTLWSDHDIRNAHHRRYTAQALLALIERAGLQVALCTHFNSRLLSLARLHRRDSSSSRKELQVPPSPVNWLFRRIFAGEAKGILRGYRRGMSMVAIVYRASAR
jgi:SAM-dependent methyltransferase